MSKIKLLSAVIVTGAGSALSLNTDVSSFQASVVGTGAVTATVTIESYDGVAWATVGTITLSGTTSASDTLTLVGRYDSVRANVTAISGTGAAVTATLLV